MPQRQRMTTRLKTLFQRPELFVLAGGINPIGAKMAEALGYDAFYAFACTMTSLLEGARA